MNYLVRVTPILRAIPDETYPEYNAGYEYGQPMDCVMNEEQYCTIDPECFEAMFLGELPEETKIC